MKNIKKTPVDYLIDLEEENEHLKKQVKEFHILYDGIFAYVQTHKDAKLGKSMVEFVLERAKKYDQICEIIKPE